MASILVAGCGYVGCELVRQLARAGHEVFALRRHPDAADDLPATVTRIAADLLDPSTLADLPAVDAVAWCASPAERSLEAYQAAYVEGVRNLIAALEPHRDRLKRFVLTSSTGVYGQQDGSDVDEDSPTEPAVDKNQAILDGERVVLEELPAGVGIVIRLAGLYGPDRLVKRLVNQVVDGLIAYDESAPCWINLIHRDDAAGAIAHLLTMDADPPRVVIGVDCEPVDRREMFAWLAGQVEIPMPPPAPGMEPPRGRNKRCRNQRLLATGYTFRFPSFREGMIDHVVDPATGFESGE